VASGVRRAALGQRDTEFHREMCMANADKVVLITGATGRQGGSGYSPHAAKRMEAKSFDSQTAR
jgi:hypothetical protein